jgi:hypothetical protein
MSVEAPKPVEETPVTATPEVSETKKAAMTTPATEEPIEATPATESNAAPLTDATNTAEVVAEATPASEGELAYKEPGLLR